MDKKYTCVGCDYQAVQKNILTKHLLSVHGGEKYPSEECDYKAKEKVSLTKHHQEVNMGKKYKKLTL